MNRIALLALLLVAAPVRADMAAPMPLSTRFAAADVVVAGKVTSVEPKPVDARLHPAANDKVPYTVVVLEVSKAFKGAKGVTHLKIGYPVNSFSPEHRRRPPYSLDKGQELCIFLAPHGDGAFHVASDYYSGINKTNLDPKNPAANAEYDKAIAEFARFAKLLEDPAKSLKSDKAEDRWLTTVLLINEYRGRRLTANPEKVKTEAVDAELSKLVLQELAKADWTKRDLGTNETPQRLFLSLGMTEKDGWVMPKDFKQLPQAAKEWIGKNAGTYRIQRNVRE